MRRRTLAVIALLWASAPVRADSTEDQDRVELRRITQEMLDAIAPGDTAVWVRNLHESFVHLDENGTVRNRTEFLKELTPLPAGLVGRIEIDTFRATLVENTAVVAYEIQEYLDYHGQSLRTRFRTLDTWLRTPDGWRLLGEHTEAVLKDPPAITLSPKALSEYEGVYSLTSEIKTTIRSGDGALTAEREGRPAVKYVAEMRDLFFAPGRPRTRRIFTRDAKGVVDGFVDRREGEDVRWTKSGH